MKRVAEIKKKRERVFWKSRCVHAGFFVVPVLTLIGFTPQKDGCSQGEGQGPPTESPREQRVRLDKIGGTGRCLYLANTGKNQNQVLSSQCTYPWRRPIDGYGGRLTIFSVSYALLYIGVTYPGDLIHTHWVVHQTVLDCGERAGARRCDGNDRLPLFVLGFCFVPGIWV